MNKMNKFEYILFFSIFGPGKKIYECVYTIFRLLPFYYL